MKDTGRKYKRLQPPKHLNAVEQFAWRTVVDNLPPAHFGKSDEMVLVTFAQTYNLLQRITGELSEQPLTQLGSTGQPVANVLIEKQLSAAGRLNMLSKTLRAAPVSRLATKEKASNPEFKGEKETDSDEIDALFMH